MLRPLKLKVFMETGASAIEDNVNAWLAAQESITIIKTETVVTGLADKPSGHPWVVVTVWYEPPPSDQERPGFRVT
jgi:hypothetical protein